MIEHYTVAYRTRHCCVYAQDECHAREAGYLTLNVPLGHEDEVRCYRTVDAFGPALTAKELAA